MTNDDFREWIEENYDISQYESIDEFIEDVISETGVNYDEATAAEVADWLYSEFEPEFKPEEREVEKPKVEEVPEIPEVEKPSFIERVISGIRSFFGRLFR